MTTATFYFPETLDRWHVPHSHPERSHSRKLVSCQRESMCLLASVWVQELAKRQTQQMPAGSHQRSRHWPHFHPNVNTSPRVWPKTNRPHVPREFWGLWQATLDTQRKKNYKSTYWTPLWILTLNPLEKVRILVPNVTQWKSETHKLLGRQRWAMKHKNTKLLTLLLTVSA